MVQSHMFIKMEIFESFISVAQHTETVLKIKRQVPFFARRWLIARSYKTQLSCFWIFKTPSLLTQLPFFVCKIIVHELYVIYVTYNMQTRLRYIAAEIIETAREFSRKRAFVFRSYLLCTLHKWHKVIWYSLIRVALLPR